MLPTARTRLNEMKARRKHVSDMPPDVAFLYWSDRARELRSNMDFSRRHEDWHEDAVYELEYANTRRLDYINTRRLNRTMRAAA